MKKYISNLVVGVDEETGLSIELRVKELNIDANIRKITVKVEELLVSPTGVEMKLIETLYYERYDGEVNKKFQQLELSGLGLGIKQMLDNDLLSYPNLTQV